MFFPVFIFVSNTTMNIFSLKTLIWGFVSLINSEKGNSGALGHMLFFHLFFFLN